MTELDKLMQALNSGAVTFALDYQYEDEITDREYGVVDVETAGPALWADDKMIFQPFTVSVWLYSPHQDSATWRTVQSKLDDAKVSYALTGARHWLDDLGLWEWCWTVSLDEWGA